MTIIGSFSTSTATALVLWLWFGADAMLVGVWYASHYVVQGVFVVIVVSRFPKEITSMDAGQLRGWDHVGVSFSFLTGALWGAAAILFVEPGNLELLLFLVAIYLGNGMGAMPMLCPYYPAFVAFVVPVFVPFAVRLVAVDNISVQVIGALMGIYLMLLLYFGRILAAFITRALATDLENERLLVEVTRAADEKSRFLASVSHDLRQPLASIGLLLGSLDRESLISRNEEAVENINHSWETLNDMCTSLLDISRLDSGTVVPKVVHFALEPMLARLTAEFDLVARRKGLRFELQHDSPIAASDPLLLERVLRNLLSNALKYTTEGGVLLSAKSGPTSIQIVIEDTGRGIAEHDLEAIFDEYYRVRPGQERTEGLGLGLAVVQQLCAILEHEVTVQSTVGRGSTFRLAVPLGDETLVSEFVDLDQVTIEGLHIAVIDDDASVCQALAALLSSAGAQTSTGRNVDGLLAVLSECERPPDVLICDYQLENETGINAIAKVRTAIDHELPALLMTGNTDPAVREAAVEANLYLLHKPVKVAHLLNAAHDLL